MADRQDVTGGGCTWLTDKMLLGGTRVAYG